MQFSPKSSAVDGQSDDASAQSDSTDNANDAGSKKADADDSKKSASSWPLPDFSDWPMWIREKRGNSRSVAPICVCLGFVVI